MPLLCLVILYWRCLVYRLQYQFSNAGENMDPKSFSFGTNIPIPSPLFESKSPEYVSISSSEESSGDSSPPVPKVMHKSGVMIPEPPLRKKNEEDLDPDFVAETKGSPFLRRSTHKGKSRSISQKMILMNFHHLIPNPRIVPTTRVARLLGLNEAARLPKRAIQFGSRIARESNRKNFGSNRAANQASAGSVVIYGPSESTIA